MFNRFTDHAKRTMNCARMAAQRQGHPFLGTEHALLGLLDVGDCSGRRILEALGVHEDPIRAEIALLIEAGKSDDSAQLPFTPAMKRALELAMMTAGELHDTYLGTEHLLLGLIRERDAIAAKALANLGVTWEKTLAKTIETENRTEDVPSVPPAPQDSSEASRTIALLRIARHLLEKNGEHDAARVLGEAIARLERSGQ